jgi:hypothetical protein
MSKKFNLSESEANKATHHLAIAKGFTGLATHFSKADGGEAAVGFCEKMADAHNALASEHEACSAAEKVLADRMNKITSDGVRGTLPDAPDSERLQLINRVGGAPLSRKAAASVSRVGAIEGESEIDPELQDLIKAD